MLRDFDWIKQKLTIAISNAEGFETNLVPCAIYP